MNKPMQERWIGGLSPSYSTPSLHMDTLLSIWPKVPLDAKILELGCNVGRQSYRLQTMGYTNLTRVDINQIALDDRTFAHTSTPVQVDLESEDWGQLEGTKWDLIFTVAVLEHLYSDRVLDKIASMALRWIAVCEDEVHLLDTHNPRNYQTEFEKRGWKQVHYCQMSEDKSFFARVFER